MTARETDVLWHETLATGSEELGQLMVTVHPDQGNFRRPAWPWHSQENQGLCQLRFGLDAGCGKKRRQPSGIVAMAARSAIQEIDSNVHFGAWR